VTVTVDWTKARTVIKRLLDFGLLFSAGALLDPGVHAYLGDHQGAATAVALVILALRAAENMFGSKTDPAPAPAAPQPVDVHIVTPPGGTDS
jgi:hypothetical protein